MTGWFKAGTTRGSPPVTEVGDCLELQVYDDAGNAQGTIIVGILGFAGLHRGGSIIKGMFLGASDLYYHWWMNQGESAPDKDDGRYHLCTEPTSQCPVIKKEPNMIHSDRYRNLGSEIRSGRNVAWLRDKTVLKGYEARFAKFEAEMNKITKKKAPASKSAAAPRASWLDHEGPTSVGSDGGEDEVSSESSVPSDSNMKERIKKLRMELKKAEDDAAIDKKKRKTAMKAMKAKATGAVGASEKEKKRKRRREAEKDHPASPEKEKKKKKRRRRGEHDKDGDEGGNKRHRSRKRLPSSEESPVATPRKKKKKKHHERSTTSSGDASTDKEALFKSKKETFDPTKKGDRDHGPFGGGPPVRFTGEEDETTESDEQVFQKGPTASAKSSQQKLLSYTNRYPGRLASRLLQKMETACARGVVGPINVEPNRTPVVAMNHIITVLLPSLGQKAGLRSIRELKTLGVILDHLAAGSPSKAADVVSQRIKAVERATHENHWGAAQYLELLPPENSLLLDKDEEMYVTKEYLLAEKLKNYDRSTPRREGDGKGKSKGAKGKTKDREKGDRGAWDKTEKTAKKGEGK